MSRENGELATRDILPFRVQQLGPVCPCLGVRFCAARAFHRFVFAPSHLISPPRSSFVSPFLRTPVLSPRGPPQKQKPHPSSLFLYHTMTDLNISLGSCTGDLTAATLQEAAAKVSSAAPTGCQSLTLTLKASELATVWPNPMDLAALPFRQQVVVVVELDNAGDALSTNLQQIHTAFLLAGCQGTSERKDGSKRVLTAQKASATSQPVHAAAIKLNSTAVTIDTDDMIDEDDLLNEEGADLAPDMKGVEQASKGDDCGGREPCADCTCGRADGKSDEKKEETQHQQPIKTSSCGKCGLGDAFRCASCPYLGMPAFKPGEEHLVLELQDDF